MRQQLLEAEVKELRAELARLQTPPVPSLTYVDSDADDMIAMIRARGIHPSEAETIATMLEDLAHLLEETKGELKEAQTWRA